MANSLSSSFPTLIALRRSWIRFLDWWLGELTVLIPASIRLWWQGASRIVLLAIDDKRATFSRPTEGGLVEILSVAIIDNTSLRSAKILQQLAQAVGRDYQLLFVAPNSQVLQRTLTLPAVLAENLRQTLAFELDRYTPFRPDQAYFDFSVANQSENSGLLVIDLAVIPRNVMDPYLAKLGAFGLKVNGVVLASDFKARGNPYRNLLPTGSIVRSPAVGRTQRITRIALGTLSILLLMTLVILPIWQKRAAAIALIAPVAQSKAAAQETDALRDQLNRLVAEHDLLPNKKWDTYSTTRIIEELTKLLPDDTFVMQFDFDGKSVQFVGETASAALMIETLEGSPLFKDVAFKSPLTKIQGSPYDRFQIGSALEGAVRPAPASVGSDEQEETKPTGVSVIEATTKAAPESTLPTSAP